MDLLPHSLEAEKALLSSFLINPDGVGRMCGERKITKAHFMAPYHASLYVHLLEMWAQEKPVDIVTMTQRLRDAGELDSIGGAFGVTELFTYMPTAANALQYVEILQEKLALREIIILCTEVGKRGMDSQTDPNELIAEINDRVQGFGTYKEEAFTSMRENVMAALDAFAERSGNSESIVLTGLHALDRDAGPLERGNLFVIGGQTKSGKTMLAVQIALNIALAGKPVLFVSLEMSKNEITQRMLCSMARVNQKKSSEWNMIENNRMTMAAADLAKAPITIIHNKTHITEIAALCQRAAYRQGDPLACIVFDYAQLAEVTKGRKDDARYQDVAIVSRTCKRLASKLNVLFVLLTQLNDDGRTREGRDLENDANMLVEVGHNRETGERGVKVVLARNGGAGQRLKLRIIPEHTRVEDDPDMVVEAQETKKRKRNWHRD